MGMVLCGSTVSEALGGGPKKFFLTKSVSCLARINHTFPDPYGVLAIVILFIDRFSLVLRCLLTFKACCCCGEATLVCRLPRVTLEYPPPYRLFA